MSFGLVRVRGSLRALSPVFHGGNEKTGSVVLLNRVKFLTENGAEDIPIISGNAIRGVLRRVVFSDFLRQVEYEIDVSTKQGQKLYHALFTGGVLETVDAKDSGVIDVELKRKIIDLIPPARLFGFSFGNQTIESKLKVGNALPICRELADYLPDDVHPRASVYELLTTAYQTRKDDLRAEREKGEQAVQMLIEYEVFAPGTVFHHEFKLEDPDEIDVSCLARAIELWQAKPFIGGKSSIGLGELKISYDIDASSEKYLNFLRENKGEIVQLLQELEGR
ncbi:RAMP superfamily CRISPR-associated protein [Geoglobus ahangari]